MLFRLRFKKLVAILLLICLVGSLVEPIAAFADDDEEEEPKKSTPDWWPYWEVAKSRENCPVDDGTKWHAKYCSCWMPLGWTTKPIRYKSQKNWRSAQFERYWKWWSRIRMNYNAMIRTKEDEAKDTSAADNIIVNTDNLLRAAGALCVADNFDGSFNTYFPDYVVFMPAAVEEMRLLKQWVDLETAWIKGISASGAHQTAEANDLEELRKLLWENEKAIATAEDVLKEIIGFGLGGALDTILGWFTKAVQTLLDAVKNIEQFMAQILGVFAPIADKVKDAIESLTNVVDQVKDKLNDVKDKVKNFFGGMVSWIPGAEDLVNDYIDDNLDVDKLLGEFNDQLTRGVGNIINNMKDSIKQIANLEIGGKSLEDWKKLIEDVMNKLGVAREWIEAIRNLKAYNYGQTQVLQAVGSQAAQMAMVANRTNREVSALMEMQITAANTKVSRRVAARNNMVLAGTKAKSVSSSGRKVKLGF